MGPAKDPVGAEARPVAEGPQPGEPADMRRTMDRIAAPFAATRQSPWPPVLSYLDGLEGGTRILDMAGGNGRHSLAAAERRLRPVLTDVSRLLPRLAREWAHESDHRFDAVEGDALMLPFRDAAFDHVLFVAGLHCIRRRSRRIHALQEMRRVLRPGGTALVSVWSAEQERFAHILAGQRRAEAVDALTADVEVGDVLLPWSKDVAEPVQRFFHVYDRSEFARDLEDARLKVDRIEAVRLTGSPQPDNFFAYVRRP